MPCKLVRAIVFGFALLHADACGAAAGVDRTSQDWVSTVVSRITEADRAETVGARLGGTVTIRVRINADGSLSDVGIDESSGSAELDERALRVVRAAGPFGPPPAKFLRLEGFTELSFSLQLAGKKLR